MTVLLPPPVLDFILDITAGPVYHPDPAQRRAAKHAHSALALVCTSWALRCRTRIFAILTLRSAEDAAALLAFAPDVHACVVDVVLEDTGTGPPWTHRVYMALCRGGFRPSITVSHRVGGAAVGTTWPLHSLYGPLPRSLPALYKSPWPLSISDHHFPSFTDLLHFSSALRPKSIYWELQLTNVSWSTLAADPPPVILDLASKRRSLCSTIDVKACPERWPFFWLCVTTRPSAKPSDRVPHVHPEEMSILAGLIRCTSPKPRPDGRTTCAHTHIYRSAPLLRQGVVSFTLQYTCTEPSPCAPTMRFTLADGRLTKLRLELVGDEPVLDRHDWGALDGLAAQAGALAEVVVQTDSGEQEQADMFVQRLGSRLARLRERGMLRFVG